MNKLTNTDIKKAIETLTEQNIPISVLNIRAYLKKGSYSTISKYLKSINPKTNTASILPEEESTFKESNESNLTQEHKPHYLLDSSKSSESSSSLDTTLPNSIYLEKLKDELSTLLKERNDLLRKKQLYQEKILKPMVSSNELLEYYIDTLLTDKYNQAIPGDLIKLLTLFLAQEKAQLTLEKNNLNHTKLSTINFTSMLTKVKHDCKNANASPGAKVNELMVEHEHEHTFGNEHEHKQENEHKCSEEKLLKFLKLFEVTNLS